MMRWFYSACCLVALVLTAFFFPITAKTAKAEDENALRINLVISEQRVLIYAGLDKGINVGQKFSVVRYNEIIGTIEITEVKARYSVAKITSSKEAVQDMDMLIPEGQKLSGPAKVESSIPKQEVTKPAASSDAKTSAAAPSAPAPAASAPSNATAADSQASSRRRSSKVEESSSTESAAAATPAAETPAKTSSGGRGRRGGSSAPPAEEASSEASSDASTSAADKSSAKSSASNSKKKSEKIDPRAFNFPTDEGMSGLWTVPTAGIIEKGKVSFSHYYEKYSDSYSYREYGDFPEQKSFSTSTKNKMISFTYGIDDSLEIFGSQIKTTLNIEESLDGTPVPATSDSIKGHCYGIKYSPKKHLILKENTSKKWTYAFAAERTKFHDTQGSKFYAIADFPYQKFDVHGGVFHYSYNGINGHKYGSFAGVELPLASRTVLIVETVLFQTKYTWNYALRYIYQDRASILLGLSDVTDTRYKSFGVSYHF